MFRSTVRISGLAALLLVLLRLAIGWHFLYEGIWKYQHPDFSAEAFLKQARGPFASKFHNLIPDYDGRQRLNVNHSKETWDDYRREFTRFYALSEEQTADAKAIYDSKIQQLELFFASLKDPATDTDEAKDYLAALEDLERRRESDRTLSEVPFQQKRYHDELTKLRAKAAPWLAEIDRLGREFKKDLDGLLEADQRAKGDAPEPMTTLDYVDALTTYGLLAIGFCLMAGLFTRLACLGGAVFLLQVVLAQPAWPTLYPPLPPSAGHSLVVTKEFIEMMALLALAATPVGRWAGIDFFIHNLLVRPFTSKESRHASKS